MTKSEEELDFEKIKLLCILSILNELQRPSVAEELQKLSMKNALD